MAFKMNGSPAKMGTISGTAGHKSALKMRKAEVGAALASPNKQLADVEQQKKNMQTTQDDRKKKGESYVDKKGNKMAGDKAWKAADKKAGGKLNDLVKSRKGLKKGTPEYNKVQNKINAAMGNKKRYDEGPAAKPTRTEKVVSKGDAKKTKITAKAAKKTSEVVENVDKKVAKINKKEAKKTHGKGSKEHLEAKKAHLKAKEADRQGEKGGKKQSIFRRLSSKINKRRQEKVDKKLAEKESSPATMYGHSKKKK